MRVYIAGPMSDIKSFNVPAFLAAAVAVRAQGFDVVLPADVEDPAAVKLMMESPDGAPGTGSLNGETWGDFLAMDVKMLADGVQVEAKRDPKGKKPVAVTYSKIDGIVFLPGWENSRGAKLEAFVGILCGLSFATYDPEAGVVTDRSVGWVKHTIAQTWMEDIAIYAPLNR